MMVMRLLLLLLLSCGVLLAEDPEKKVLPLSTLSKTEENLTVSQVPNYTYSSFIDWTAACLHSYDEQFMPSSFPSKTILPYVEFVRAFREYKKKMLAKGILNKEIWNAVDRKTASVSKDFEHPYATVLDMDDGSQVCFMGDLHGSLHSLLRNLWRLVALGYLNDQFKITKKHFYLVFTGDYVDRGRYGIEVLYTLLRLKIANWGRVHLIRGNHEMIDMNKKDGFYEELTTKYEKNKIDQYMGLLSIVYDTMPLAVYITSHNQIIKVAHGGFAPYDYYNTDWIMQKSIKIKNDQADPLVRKRYSYIPLTGSAEHFDSGYAENKTPGYQWCDFEPFVYQENISNVIYPIEGRVWRVNGAASQQLLEQRGISLMIRGHQHAGFGLKVVGVADTLDEFAPHQSFIDSSSGLFNWIAALWHLGESDAIREHNESNGFLVSKMIPIFTFSSAVEGVGLNYDCFGILTLDGMFPTWRLKVYEYPVSFASKFKAISSIQQPFTVIMKYGNPNQFRKITSTSGMQDSIFIKFLTREHVEDIDQETIKGWLQEIVNASAGNGQSASKNVTE